MIEYLYHNKESIMFKIAITGGAGFIAFHLAQSLHADGHEVIGLDNFNDYYDPALKRARARKLAEIGIGIAKCDLKDKSDVHDFMKLHHPDLVIHLGAYAGVRHSLENPQVYIDNNITGTQNLIDACTANNVQHVVYASTSCTMAGNQLPWKEDEKTGYQLNPYGYSKSTNECQFMASTLKNAIGLRFFTVYGPWGRPDMALFTFTKNIVDGKPITLYNNGDMIRDFTYVDDIVQGIKIVTYRCLDQNNAGEKEIYNIGYGDKVPLMEFVDHIEKNLGRTAIKDYAPMHPADTQATWSDTTKLQKLGYKPTTDIATGVERFVTWYKSYYGVN